MTTTLAQQHGKEAELWSSVVELEGMSDGGRPLLLEGCARLDKRMPFHLHG